MEEYLKNTSRAVSHFPLPTKFEMKFDPLVLNLQKILVYKPQSEGCPNLCMKHLSEDANRGDVKALILCAFCSHTGSYVPRNNSHALSLLMKILEFHLDFGDGNLIEPVDKVPQVLPSTTATSTGSISLQKGVVVENMPCSSTSQVTKTLEKSNLPSQKLYYIHHALICYILHIWFQKGITQKVNDKFAKTFLARATSLGFKLNQFLTMLREAHQGADFHDNISRIGRLVSRLGGSVDEVEQKAYFNFRVGLYYETGVGGVKKNYHLATQKYTQTKGIYFPAVFRLALMSLNSSQFELWPAVEQAARKFATAQSIFELAESRCQTNLNFTKIESDIESQQSVSSIPNINQSPDRKLSPPKTVDLKFGAPTVNNEIWLLYIKAASMGHAKAQHQVGQIFKSGSYGIFPDLRKSMYWFRKAACQGNTKSLEILNDESTLSKTKNSIWTILEKCPPLVFEPPQTFTSYTKKLVSKQALDFAIPTFDILATIANETATPASLNSSPLANSYPIPYNFADRLDLNQILQKLSQAKSPLDVPPELKTDGYQQLSTLLRQFDFLKTDQLIQDRYKGFEKVDVLLMNPSLFDLKKIKGEEVAILISHKEAMIKGEVSIRLERHKEAILKFGSVFMGFTAVFDLSNFFLRVLVSISVQNILTTYFGKNLSLFYEECFQNINVNEQLELLNKKSPSRKKNEIELTKKIDFEKFVEIPSGESKYEVLNVVCHALLVDCFINIFSRKPEISLIHINYVLSLNPNDCTGNLLYAIQLCKLEKLDLALYYFEKSLQNVGKTDLTKKTESPKRGGKEVPVLFNNHSVEILYARGKCFLAMKKYDLAIKDFKDAVGFSAQLQFNRRVPDLHYHRSYANYCLGNAIEFMSSYANAISAEERCIPIYPTVFNIKLKEDLLPEYLFTKSCHSVTGKAQIRATRWSNIPSSIQSSIQKDLKSKKVTTSDILTDDKCQRCCEKHKNLEWCAGCSNVAYCGNACQVVDWVNGHCESGCPGSNGRGVRAA